MSTTTGAYIVVRDRGARNHNAVLRSKYEFSSSKQKCLSPEDGCKYKVNRIIMEYIPDEKGRIEDFGNKLVGYERKSCDKQ